MADDGVDEPEMGGDFSEETRIETKEEFWTDIGKEAKGARLRIKICVCCCTSCQGHVPFLSLYAGVHAAVNRDFVVPILAFSVMILYCCNALHGCSTSLLNLRRCFRCFYYNHWCMVCYVCIMVLLTGCALALCFEPGDHLENFNMCKQPWPLIALLLDLISMLCLAPPLLWCSNELRKYLNIRKHKKKMKKVKASDI